MILFFTMAYEYVSSISLLRGYSKADTRIGGPIHYKYVFQGTQAMQNSV